MKKWRVKLQSFDKKIEMYIQLGLHLTKLFNVLNMKFITFSFLFTKCNNSGNASFPFFIKTKRITLHVNILCFEI